MAARSCAQRTHQLAASILSHGVGPSRLPAALICPCQSHAVFPVSPLTPRSFSASAHRHEEESVKSRSEDLHQQDETSLSNRVQPRRTVKSVRLLAEDDVVDAEPTLEYLDSLKPRIKRFQREDSRSKRGNVNPFTKTTSKVSAEDKQWDRTKSRIHASFTRDQLASLSRAAKLPGSYNTKVRKDELVRRIMVHRFGMEDAKERADREKREELQKRSVHISFRPAELYLLLSRGSGKVRQEASKAQVAILPRPPPKQTDSEETSEKLGFWIRGRDEGITRMTQWVESFKTSVKTKIETITLTNSDSSDANGEVLPAELVRFISQASRCFMEASPISDGKVALNLAYLEERNAQKAVLLLRQYQAESVDAMQRLGSAAYCNDVVTLRQYSMVPFVPNEPTSWIKEADDLLFGVNSDISFRVAHIPDVNAFLLPSTTKLPGMKVKGWTHDAEMQFDDPFQALLEQASSAAKSGISPLLEGGEREVELSAQLGHVLFTSDGLTLVDDTASEAEALSRLQDPLAAPLPGVWPFEHALAWAKDFRSRFGREASRFVPATLFRLQKSISLDIWLERQGYVLANQSTSVAASDKLVLVYHPSEAGYGASEGKLEVVLKRKKSDGDILTGAQGNWIVDEARWTKKAEADLMIPEKSSDLRLTAKTVTLLRGEAFAAVEEALASYCSTKPAAKHVSEATEVVEGAEAEEADADTEGENDASEMLDIDTEVVERSVTDNSSEAMENTASSDPATSSKGLPPSSLTISSLGAFALESATRVTVQAYQQRSALAGATFLPTAAEAPSPSSAAEPVTTRAESKSGDFAAAPSTSESTEQLNDASAIPHNDPTIDSKAITSDPITTAEVASSEAVVSESKSMEESASEEPNLNTTQEPVALSTTLFREISQDLATQSTTESVRIVWRISSSSPSVPRWNEVVEPISALIERYNVSVR
ncbi:uncharacterized protein MEPE_00633 [Melanopsichium pennsylvanicum]|uniref:Uncharacterized protein n=2 Tax=Melanopsichium pennsylvanicum TaxID=63383 RepID=A0AAJ5C2V6_9BASI|nr:hypothetical protein BN887_05425 [Melanopsichium pennsylvanicum 4]SNX81928.1 uncharacterized protein MEPE_00633 [Melanopsichium pennsylvanicum]